MVSTKIDQIQKSVSQVLEGERALLSLYKNLQKDFKSVAKKDYTDDEAENIKNMIDILIRDSERHFRNLEILEGYHGGEVPKVIM